MNDSTEGSAATSTTADVTMTTIPVTATTNGSTDVLTTAATIVAALEEVSTPETLNESVFSWTDWIGGGGSSSYGRKLLKLVLVLHLFPPLPHRE